MELVDNYTQVFCLHLIYFVFYYKKKEKNPFAYKISFEPAQHR